MVEEAIRNAFMELAKERHCDFHQIYCGEAASYIFGMDYDANPEWQEAGMHTFAVARDVQYDMMIEESR